MATDQVRTRAEKDSAADSEATLAGAIRGLSSQRRQAIIEAWRATTSLRDEQLENDLRNALQQSWNDYLAGVTPKMLAAGHIREMYGMWIFVLDYPAKINHVQIAQAVLLHSGREAELLYWRLVSGFCDKLVNP